MSNFICTKCGQSKPLQTEGGTGYANTIDNPICYACCGDIDKQHMVEVGRMILYLVKGHVSNWPDSLRFSLTSYRIGKHNMAGKRYDVHFDGPDGYRWHGVTYGDNTQICHCRRTKVRLAKAGI